MSKPEQVTLYEVGPRDGLQNEEQTIPPEQKIELIERLAGAGLSYVEAGSFVHPKWVPQMADTDEVLSGIHRRDGVTYPVLVPNEEGLDRAIQAGADEIAVFVSASETFSQKNLNCSIDESFARLEPVFAKAHQNQLSVRGYVSCIAGCPYEGDVSEARVSGVAGRLIDQGCYEVSLGDTIGVGTPDQIRDVIDTVKGAVDVSALALHCHDTYGQGLVNIYAALQEGISVVDSSVGGLGGCPYADGATGNVATEDVLYMLDGMGIDTGVDMEAVVETAWFIGEVLGQEPDSRVAHAMQKH